jgi:hypothetical protein
MGVAVEGGSQPLDYFWFGIKALFFFQSIQVCSQAAVLFFKRCKPFRRPTPGAEEDQDERNPAHNDTYDANNARSNDGKLNNSKSHRPPP